MPRRKQPRWLQPRAIEIQYYRQLQTLIEAIRQSVADNLDYVPGLPERFDDDTDDFISRLRTAVMPVYQATIGKLSMYFADTSRFNWTQWRKQVKAGAQYELPTVAPFDEQGISTLADNWAKANVALINNLTESVYTSIELLIRNEAMRGISKSALKQKILDAGLPSGRFKDADTRAEFIATDQILKANSVLAEQRMSNAAVSYYTWRGVMDSRERDSHKELEGMKFRVDGKPMTDADLKAAGVPNQKYRHPSEVDSASSAPGFAYRCRCHAEPDFTGSVFDLERDD